MLKSGQIPIGQYQQIKDLPIPDNAKEIIRSNLIDKKYREESAKIVMPLKNDNDNLELSSSVLEESVIINFHPLPQIIRFIIIYAQIFRQMTMYFIALILNLKTIDITFGDNR
jgi:hypothetical protein